MAKKPIRLAVDLGNAQGKVYDVTSGVKLAFPHAIAPIADSKWRSLTRRAQAPIGIIRVNGQAFAVGNAARRHRIRERPNGAARYTTDYYGVALAYAMTEVYRRSVSGIRLYASHPPRDLRDAPLLKTAAAGTYEVESAYGTLTFAVDDVFTFDEPLGGYSHYLLTKDGQQRKGKLYSEFTEKTVLVLDVGGYTIDVVPIDEGGDIDHAGAGSTVGGTLNMLYEFEDAIRDRYAKLFRATGDISVERLEYAVTTGEYRYGNMRLDVSEESKEHRMALVNDVIDVINHAGGAANFDVILITGGGGALLVDDLRLALPTIDFVMADSNRDMMRYANVVGGAKLYALIEAYQRQGAR